MFLNLTLYFLDKNKLHQQHIGDGATGDGQ